MNDENVATHATGYGPAQTANAMEIETRSFEFVPLSERFGTIRDQQKFWFMANASLMTLLSGAVGQLFGLGLGWTLISIVVGSLAGTVFQALHAAQGPIMGIPQMIQSRVQFGSRGVLLPLVAAMIVLCGFPLFALLSGASALTHVIPVQIHTAFIVIGLVAVAAAIYGYRLLLLCEKVVAYFVCANFALLTVAVAFVVPWDTAFTNGWTFSGPGFLTQLGASAMLQLGVAPLVSDYTPLSP